MGRPQQYGSAAERQQAYRERLEAEMVRVNRRDLERLETHLERLNQAVRAAARAEDPVAQRFTTVSILGMLIKMTDYFEEKVKEKDTES